MRTVAVTHKMPGSVHEAETCWYDVGRWVSWIDGLARVREVSDEWPAAGARVVWESGPAGRGTVTEQVVSHEPLSGQTVEVQDDSIRGRQSVSFTPADEQVEVELRLDYEVSRRSLLTPLVDLLFIRGAMERSLRATLTRFAAELASTRQPDAG